jgi:hypothetical protein
LNQFIQSVEGGNPFLQHSSSTQWKDPQHYHRFLFYFQCLIQNQLVNSSVNVPKIYGRSSLPHLLLQLLVSCQLKDLKFSPFLKLLNSVWCLQFFFFYVYIYIYIYSNI